ncbi:P-loop containing nucleoside triphosphate hydrolase protein [Mycena leptocephala]|nr:P-loop containing nucleoside triphosphate hydrolase protein [Mycena leptocephala]
MPIGRLLLDERASDGWNRPITAGSMASPGDLGSDPIASDSDVVIKTRMLLHINHKQKAVSRIQFFFSSHLRLFASSPKAKIPSSLSPIDWSCAPHLLEAQWMTVVVSAVSAYPVSSPCTVIAAPISAAFCYVPFQMMSQCLSCRGKADDDDFGSVKLPNSAFTPDGEHIHPSTITPAFSLSVLAATLAIMTYTETSKQFDGVVLFASFSLFRGKARFSLASSWTLVAPSSYLYCSFHFCYSPSTPLPLISSCLIPLFLSFTLSLLLPPLTPPPAPVSTNDVPPTHPLCHCQRAQRPRTPLACLPHAALRGRAICGRSGAGGGGVGEGAGVGVGGEGEGKKEKEGGEKEKQNEEDQAHEPDELPFALHDITLSIPRGTLATVVVRVGSGKSTLLKGLIGEMRSTDTGGKWAFGGSVIQSATWRDKVLFGQPFAEERYWCVIEDSCLLPDLQLLADEDLMEMWTEAVHAVYYSTDVVIFDDPLSADLCNQVPDHGWQPAVDAKVGKALFRSAIQGLVAQGKTILLVTHALHFLTQCDYIYTLDHGRIAKAGTYPELIAEDTGGEGAGENGDEDEAQVQVVSVEDVFLGKISTTMLCPDLTEDPAIVAKRTELAQRMKMLEGVRKDLMAFEK